MCNEGHWLLIIFNFNTKGITVNRGTPQLNATVASIHFWIDRFRDSWGWLSIDQI